MKKQELLLNRKVVLQKVQNTSKEKGNRGNLHTELIYPPGPVSLGESLCRGRSLKARWGLPEVGGDSVTSAYGWSNKFFLMKKSQYKVKKTVHVLNIYV